MKNTDRNVSPQRVVVRVRTRNILAKVDILSLHITRNIANSNTPRATKVHGNINTSSLLVWQQYALFVCLFIGVVRPGSFRVKQLRVKGDTGKQKAKEIEI